MEASELRIGNYVNDRFDSQVIVCDITHTGINLNYGYSTISINELKPIPLTEEWLLRFGFVKIRGLHLCKGYSLNSGEYLVYIDDRGVYLKTNKNIFIKYVHQLQNLYFALTGEELTLKSE